MSIILKLNLRERVYLLQEEMRAPDWSHVGFKTKVLPVETALPNHAPRHHGDYLAGMYPVEIRAYWEAWLLRLLDLIEAIPVEESQSRDKENETMSDEEGPGGHPNPPPPPPPPPPSPPPPKPPEVEPEG